MISDHQFILSRIIIAIPFGIGAIVFFVLGFKRNERFITSFYQGNSKGKFKDNLISSIYFALSSICLFSAFITYQAGELSWGLIPLSLCMVVGIVPIIIFGTYWQSFMAKKLWGGFLPLAQEQNSFDIPSIQIQRKLTPSDFRLNRKVIILASIIALFIFFGLYLLLQNIMGWNGSVFSGIIFRLLISGLAAFGVFMTIISVSLSRKIKKIRDGEPVDDDM